MGAKPSKSLQNWVGNEALIELLHSHVEQELAEELGSAIPFSPSLIAAAKDLWVSEREWMEYSSAETPLISIVFGTSFSIGEFLLAIITKPLSDLHELGTK